MNQYDFYYQRCFIDVHRRMLQYSAVIADSEWSFDRILIDLAIPPVMTEDDYSAWGRRVAAFKKAFDLGENDYEHSH